MVNKMAKLHIKSRQFVKNNGSTILTFIGVCGVVLTSIEASKSTLKATELLKTAEEEKGEELTVSETILVVGPTYIPTLLLGASTIACIVGANVLNKRQQASLISAYAFVENSYKEYRNKLKELYGNETDIRIRDEIVKDKYIAEPPIISVCGLSPITCVEELAEDETIYLFYDELSQRYFESTFLSVQSAEYHLNRNMVLGLCCTPNDFYDFLGIPKTTTGDDKFWACCDSYYWLDFDHREVMLEDGLKCIVISPVYEPLSDYME